MVLKCQACPSLGLSAFVTRIASLALFLSCFARTAPHPEGHQFKSGRSAYAQSVRRSKQSTGLFCRASRDHSLSRATKFQNAVLLWCGFFCGVEQPSPRHSLGTFGIQKRPLDIFVPFGAMPQTSGSPYAFASGVRRPQSVTGAFRLLRKPILTSRSMNPLV